MTTPTVRRQPNKNVAANIKIHCGCGFKASNHQEAIGHVESTKHHMFVSGEIVPAVDKGRVNAYVPQPGGKR